MDGTLLTSFLAFNSPFRGGVRVAAGDVNGDGLDDIITAAGSGTPQVRVFDGYGGLPIANFLAFGRSFRGGVFVAAGDVNGDGLDDIIAGNGVGVPHVHIFDATTRNVISEFVAYSGTGRGAIVATTDYNADGIADIIVSKGAGGDPLVRTFHGTTHALLHSFFPFPASYRGGVFVA